jgi:hypothetical protein
MMQFLWGLLVAPGAALAQIYEDDDAYEFSDEMEGEEGLFGFTGDVPPSVRRSAEAGERLVDDAEDEISEELGDEREDE